MSHLTPLVAKYEGRLTSGNKVVFQIISELKGPKKKESETFYRV
jgi:hypothetical protein